MALKIVLTGDDFGASHDTVQATIDCLERGLLTGTSIMARMPATDEAIAFACSHPEFAYGVHLTFVGDGRERPVSDAKSVSSLVDGDGRFLSSKIVRSRAISQRLSVDEIEREATAQIALIRDAGVRTAHLDSHRHLHKFAPFRIALQRVQPRFDMHCVRNVQDVFLRRPLQSPTYWLGRTWRRKLMNEFVTTDHFYMPTSASDRQWERLAIRLQDLTGKSIEVGLHPGTEEAWRRVEVASLMPFVKAALRAGHELVRWSEVHR